MEIEVAHWMAFIPFACLFGMAAVGRHRPGCYWLFAIACAISWLIDSAVADGDGAFVGAYILAGIQMALLAVSVSGRMRDAFFASLAVAAVTFVAPLLVSSDLVTLVFVFGSAIPIVSWLLIMGDAGDVRWPVAVYVICGGLFSLWIVADLSNWNVWRAYQVTRVVAFGLFIHAAYKWRKA